MDVLVGEEVECFSVNRQKNKNIQPGPENQHSY